MNKRKWVEDWDQYYMTEAYNKAMKSKDPRTKMGAVIIGPDHEPISNGYNNFPRGLDDTLIERYKKPLKLKFFEHAERNAIYNAARHSVGLIGSRMYVPWFPCSDCARGIIQSGIVEVIYHKEFPKKETSSWIEDQAISMVMFEECGVAVREWSGELLSLRILCSGKEYSGEDLK